MTTHVVTLENLTVMASVSVSVSEATVATALIPVKATEATVSVATVKESVASTRTFPILVATAR